MNKNWVGDDAFQQTNEPFIVGLNQSVGRSTSWQQTNQSAGWFTTSSAVLWIIYKAKITTFIVDDDDDEVTQQTVGWRVLQPIILNVCYIKV